MFVVQSDPEGAPYGRVLVDADRDALVRKVAGQGRVPGYAFVLVWRGQTVPFDDYPVREQDPVTGQEYVLHRIPGIGDSPMAQLRGVVASPITVEQMHEAEPVIVQAMLAFGGSFDGTGMPDGAVRVVVQDRTYRRSDFAS